jgi:hypothetical protein
MNELSYCWSKVTIFRITRITCFCALLISRTKASFVLLIEHWLLEQFCCSDVFVVIMVFYVIMENTNIVANFLIFLVPKFHDPMPYVLAVTNFRSLLLGFAYSLSRSKCLVCLICVHIESCLGDHIRSVVLFLSFPKC